MAEALNKRLVGLYVLTQATDVATTLYGIQTFGNQVEANEYVRALFTIDQVGNVGFDQMGEFVVFPAAKLALVLLTLGLAKSAEMIGPAGSGSLPLLAGVGLGGAVSLNNFVYIISHS